MNKTSLLIMGILAAFALGGCANGEAEVTKQEQDALKNPSKTIPPEAVAGMAKMGEAMKKQAEQNKAAGVDSRGIPIGKSNDPSAGAPPEAATKTGG